MIKYPSIPNFKELSKQVAEMTRYCGKNEDGYPLYDDSIPLPALKFFGSEKLHGCFEKNTLITLVNGETIPISELQIGTYVLSYDTKNECEIYKKITNVFNRNDNNVKWCKLTFDDRYIICTKDHKFYTKNRGWVEAQHLTFNDVFITEQYVP